MDKISYLGNADVNAIEHLYNLYRQAPDSVDIGWQKFFEGFDFSKTRYESEQIPQSNEDTEHFKKEVKVLNLINGYRTRGHLFTKTNPVRDRRQHFPTLDIANFDLEDKDLDTVFKAGEEIGTGTATLREIIHHLEKKYCESIGIEFMYMDKPPTIKWMLDAVELTNRPVLTPERKIHVYRKLMQTVGFETFLGKKFVGQKRFSIEGLEALIPALDALVGKGVELGVEHFVVGMAHRGRLNTLTNIFEKQPRDIFAEFEGKEFDFNEEFDGDVKYHQGYTTFIQRQGKRIKLILAPNPSHLEAVDPVVEGLSRAKLDIRHNGDLNKVCPVLIHGDAAIAGQGIVYETIQMSTLRGYKTGGTIHIVTNNQVGFTTDYTDGRSSIYCTDVAKTTLSPVFHVNADDVEAVVQAIEIAVAYRQKFHTDVFIDILGYRKFGHNEGDEPKFTQPQLYNLIAKHKNPSFIYLEKLIAEKCLTKQEADDLYNTYQRFLEDEYNKSQKQSKATVFDFMQEEWNKLERAEKIDFELSPSTGVPKEKLLELGSKLSTLPKEKKYFRKIQKIFNDRYEAIERGQLDWGSAEMLAYATLLDEGHPVRISGQDVERGTFSHRHAVVKTEDNEEKIVTLNLLNDTQAKFQVYNSLLSEYAVLGFEYGYSTATPHALTIWEAQFGDFFNGAQIMIDQFITAGEDKWSTQSGLVLLLPHGYEGQGSEHSSGRLERFLQQAADLNIQIVNPSTPANHFHVLRRQLKRPFRKPLVVFSPKLLLRHPLAISSLDEMTEGNFREVIDDPKASVTQVEVVVFCSGKFYYDAVEKAKELGVDNMAFVRVEQLYPFPEKQINSILKKYVNHQHIIWAQEEPENMGAWRYMAMKMRSLNIIGITRPESAASAEGSKELHIKRLRKLWTKLFQYAPVNA